MNCKVILIIDAPHAFSSELSPPSGRIKVVSSEATTLPVVTPQMTMSSKYGPNYH